MEPTFCLDVPVVGIVNRGTMAGKIAYFVLFKGKKNPAARPDLELTRRAIFRNLALLQNQIDAVVLTGGDLNEQPGIMELIGAIEHTGLSVIAETTGPAFDKLQPATRIIYRPKSIEAINPIGWDEIIVEVDEGTPKEALSSLPGIVFVTPRWTKEPVINKRNFDRSVELVREIPRLQLQVDMYPDTTFKN